MTAQLYLGKPVAEALDARTGAGSAKLRAAGVEPTLAIVRVGQRPDGIAYERSAAKRACAGGLAVRHIDCPGDVTLYELLSLVHKLNTDASVHGVLLLRPFPAHLDENLICNSLAPEKDVDGTTVISSAGTYTGGHEGCAPCTARACLELLDYYQVPLEGKSVLVIGRSLVVGKPVAMMLLERNATVTIAHSHSKGLPQLARQADIIIAAAGQAGMVTAEYLRAGQHVLDVGVSFTPEGTMVGDVAFEQAVEVVAGITPVPRGLGSITTSVLCLHVVEATQRALAAEG